MLKLLKGSKVKLKARGHLRTGHKGPGVEYRYSSILPLTSALDGGGWSAPHLGRLTPGKHPVPILEEAGWVSLEGCGKSRPHQDLIIESSSP